MANMVFHDLISSVLEREILFNNIWFAGNFHTPEVFSYQVDFPRLELVLHGSYINEIENHEHKIINIIAEKGDVIFIPPNCWNNPRWDAESSVLTILFGRRHLGFSLVSKQKGETEFYDIKKHSIRTRTGFALDNILDALSSLARESDKKPMDYLLLQALLHYSKNILAQPEIISSDRSKELYQDICIYIKENYCKPINRGSISNRFSISVNHLSRIFRQQGHMSLADYITWVRIEKAKVTLKSKNFKLSDIAIDCGFKDVNYFCRVFKKCTGITPTEYRKNN